MSQLGLVDRRSSWHFQATEPPLILGRTRCPSISIQQLSRQENINNVIVLFLRDCAHLDGIGLLSKYEYMHSQCLKKKASFLTSRARVRLSYITVCLKSSSAKSATARLHSHSSQEPKEVELSFHNLPLPSPSRHILPYLQTPPH